AVVVVVQVAVLTTLPGLGGKVVIAPGRSRPMWQFEVQPGGADVGKGGDGSLGLQGLEGVSWAPGQIRNDAVVWTVQTRLPSQSLASGSVTTHPVQLSSLASEQPGKPEAVSAAVEGPALVPPSPCSLQGVGVPVVTGVQP